MSWATPWGYRPRSTQPTNGWDPNNPFRGLNDFQQLYNRDNPQVVTQAFFDAMTGGRRNTPLARWLQLRQGEMLSRFQQVAPFLGPEAQYSEWLDEHQTGLERRYGAPTRESLVREFREQSASQRGEEPYAVRRANPYG